MGLGQTIRKVRMNNMDAVVGITISAFLIMAGLVLKNNKILFIIQSIWILILICFNSNSADFLNTQALYDNTNSLSLGSEGFFMNGYYFLSILAKNLGLNFIEFNGILAAISTILIYYVILKLSNNICIAMSLFMLYPLVSSVIQKRWYLAMGIIVLACYLLLEVNNKKIATIWYIILIALACQFHTAAVYFFTLIIFYWIPDKFKNFVEIFGLFFLSLFRNQLSVILQSTDNKSLAGKSEFYFETLASNNLWHYLFWLIWHLLFVLLIIYLLKDSKVREVLGDKYSNYLKILNMWSLLIIPLYSFDPVFSRLFRVVILFNYIAISNIAIVKDFKIRIKYVTSITYQVALSLSTFIIFNALAGMPFDQLVFPVFQSNVLINSLI